jgi:hypothetical protein
MVNLKHTVFILQEKEDEYSLCSECLDLLAVADTKEEIERLGAIYLKEDLNANTVGFKTTTEALEAFSLTISEIELNKFIK